MSTLNHDTERLTALCRKIKNQRREIKGLNKALRIQALINESKMHQVIRQAATIQKLQQERAELLKKKGINIWEYLGFRRIK